jgi:multicomponent Na+:H+ antiporter subunit E
MFPNHPRLAWGIQVFAVLLPVWFVLDAGQNLWVGIVAAFLGAMVGAFVAPATPYGWRPLQLLSFAGFFVLESLRGAADVAWRALHPRLPIDPHLERYEISLAPGKPRTLFVSVVSLLPGTLSADLSADGRLLEVHAITGDPGEALRRLERRIDTLFSTQGEGNP